MIAELFLRPDVRRRATARSLSPTTWSSGYDDRHDAGSLHDLAGRHARGDLAELPASASSGQSASTSVAGGSMSSVGTPPRQPMPRLARDRIPRANRVQPSSRIMNFMRLRCLCW